MNEYFSRRGFIRYTTAAAGSLSMGIAAQGSSDAEYPMVDYHVHPEGDMTLGEVVEMCQERGVKIGIVEHAGREGHNYANLISNDAAMKRHLAMLDKLPVYKGIQAEGIDWAECFSVDVVAQLDYVLMDAMTVPDKDGNLVEIWRPGAMDHFAGREDFMQRYTDFHVAVITRTPIDIFANPLALPGNYMKEYDTVWTEKRLRRIVEAAVNNNVALEIGGMGNRGERFYRMAKEAGAKFSFGTNARGKRAGMIDNCIKMAKKIGLTREDIFTLAPAGKKPIQIRKFA